jgi:hypothetical protein
MTRRANPDLNKVCIKCNTANRGPRGDCKTCNKVSAFKLRARRASELTPCPTCNQTSWTKGGLCRVCIVRSRDKKAADPCDVCGGVRNRFAACLACKRQSERTRLGIQDAPRDTGVGKFCGICKIILTARRYALDHDHQTGAIRGWLCVRCNTGIGSFGDNPELLRAAALYIEKHQSPLDLRVTDQMRLL